MANLVDYYYKQPFLDAKTKTKVWYLIDVIEATSLLKNSGKTEIVAHLFSPETKKLKRVSLAELDSRYLGVNSSMVDEVIKLNKFLNLDLDLNFDS